MKEIHLGEPVTKALIDFLGSLGNLEYYPSFARPFFRVDVPLRFILKGIEGDRRMRVVLSREETDSALTCLVDAITSFETSDATGQPMPRG